MRCRVKGLADRKRSDRVERKKGCVKEEVDGERGLGFVSFLRWRPAEVSPARKQNIRIYERRIYSDVGFWVASEDR